MIPFRPGALASTKRPAGSIWLRWVLVFVDTEAIFLAWASSLVFFQRVPVAGRSSTTGVAITVALTASGLLLMASQELYLARVSSIRAVEMTRIFRVSVLTALVAGLGAEILDGNIAAVEAGFGGLLMLVFLVIGRSAYRAWLTTRRAAGEYRRDVIIVGSNDEAKSLYDLLTTHTEIGLEVAAVYGDAAQARANGLDHVYAGTADQCVDIIGAQPISGVLFASTALPSPVLNRLVRELLSLGVHVQITSGLRGIASRRLRAQPLAHEPMIYLEQLTLSWWQIALKRAIDILLAGLGLLFVGPVILAFALIVKITDRGPAFFHQERIGRSGEHFKMIKIRTMVVDAEARLEALKTQTNERSGPLFKMEHDPRFTRVGRLMDVTSINELPQLWNVLRGDMSLVGPRPALPKEAAMFDAELHARNLVRPGITGLWQVEARDNPDFSAYKRLDLHYVENWSVAFDLIIILQTVESIAARVLKAVSRRPQGDKPARAADRAAERAAAGKILTGDGASDDGTGLAEEDSASANPPISGQDDLSIAHR
ncbi:MAG: sugar transferase [Actinomycetia bacterium]|nr:sugar transferase [Actinomycetes bacterium]MCP4958293.1 sugar transferase [Actinomycetes bacterium]